MEKTLHGLEVLHFVEGGGALDRHHRTRWPTVFNRFEVSHLPPSFVNRVGTELTGRTERSALSLAFVTCHSSCRGDREGGARSKIDGLRGSIMEKTPESPTAGTMRNGRKNCETNRYVNPPFSPILW